MPKKAKLSKALELPTAEQRATALKGMKIKQRTMDRAKSRARLGPEYTRPVLPDGVIPDGHGMAMDDAGIPYNTLSYINSASYINAVTFKGYPYLAQLATRAEYRNMADALAVEMTREWIEFKSTVEGDESKSARIKELEEEFKRLNVRDLMKRAVTHDAWYGRGQFFLDIKGQNRKRPLILSPRTIPVGSLQGITTVEAMWSTPSDYNALDPAAPDFYKPIRWFMLGQEVHSSRLLTVITRPVSDMLKPSFNFSGISLSQIAEPYVDNWLRTRQSVSDMLNNFSITALKTNMAQALTAGDDDQSIFDRADMFTALRANRGLMLLDFETEDIVQQNVPLGGLADLQAQSQEHMCSVTRIPAMILTGISPSGLNASSDGEMRAWYDWIAAQQDANWLNPITIIMKVVMLHLWGEIDESIVCSFKPLYQLSPLEESTKRVNDSTAAANYINANVLDPSEVRQNLASDPSSGYSHIDPNEVIVPPDNGTGDMFGKDPLEDDDEAGDGKGGAPTGKAKPHTNA